MRLTRQEEQWPNANAVSTRPLGGVFVAHSQVLTSADVLRALTRMAHEVVERNGGVEDVVLVGLQTGGVPLATKMAEILRQIEAVDTLAVGSLDVAFYRDDIGLRPVLPEAVTDIPVDLAGKVVVLVDDVLFTGRTIRAALERPQRLRPGPRHPARRHGRPRPPRAAHPARLRGEEPPDAARGDGRRRRGRRLDRQSGGQVTGTQHLLSVADLGPDGIAEVLRVAEAFAEVERRSVPKVPTLRGKVVATLFFEESTRTRLSFETAAKRLSADVLSLAVASSSVKKGESLRDTVETVEAMGIDAIIIRHSSAGAPHQVARWVERAHVVNAGDGWHEHPTQALLDCFTVRQVLAERKGAAPEELGIACFEGLRVLIVGDVRHSRVARSEVLAYTALGAHVTLAAPGSLLPPSLEGWPVEVATDLDAALGDADVVSLLRLQAERGSGSFVPSLREYTAGWGLTARRAERLAEDAIVTHPGPMVRGVEIASDVADLPRTVVTQQVANGVAVRMAILFLLLGGELPGIAEVPAVA